MSDVSSPTRSIGFKTRTGGDGVAERIITDAVPTDVFDVPTDVPEPISEFSPPNRASRRETKRRLARNYGKLRARATRYDQQLMKKKRLHFEARNGNPKNAVKAINEWVQSVNSKRLSERSVYA